VNGTIGLGRARHDADPESTMTVYARGGISMRRNLILAAGLWTGAEQ
jgi:hypothetical protein